MKVLLIQLYDYNVPVYPIGLAYIATALGGHHVRVLDQNTCEGDPYDETGRVVRDFRPDVVGISIRNLHFLSPREKKWKFYYEQLTPTIKAIRKAHKEAIIVTGGAGFSMFPHEVMKNDPEIDYGVYCEGENSFRALIENLDAPHKVAGIFIRRGEEISLIGNYTQPDFTSLEPPSRNFFNPRLYKEEYAIGVQSKRGCALKCIYCNYPSLSGNFLRLRPPQQVVDEIEKLQSLYGVQEFTFIDNVFNIPLSHAEEICKEMINRKLRIQWTAWFNEQFMNKDFVDLIVAAGCRTIELSPDGYSNKSLKWLKKNIRTKDIIKTYKLLKNKPDIEIKYHFMMGIPGQGVFSLMAFAFFYTRLKIFLGRRLTRFHINKLYIFPNTDVEKLAIKDGIITKKTDLFSPISYEVGFISRLFKILRRCKRLYAK
jgi:putative variant cofactor biosynthesis B12-binding/radical SAM domain protein 1